MCWETAASAPYFLLETCFFSHCLAEVLTGARTGPLQARVRSPVNERCVKTASILQSWYSLRSSGATQFTDPTGEVWGHISQPPESSGSLKGPQSSAAFLVTTEVPISIFQVFPCCGSTLIWVLGWHSHTPCRAATGPLESQVSARLVDPSCSPRPSSFLTSWGEGGEIGTSSVPSLLGASWWRDCRLQPGGVTLAAPWHS